MRSHLGSAYGSKSVSEPSVVFGGAGAGVMLKLSDAEVWMSAVRKRIRVRPKKRVAVGAAARGLTEALAEASWAEADRALAMAIAELADLETAPNAARRAAAMVLLSQSLARAARRRGLTRFGAQGAVEPYDAQRHELARKPVRPPARVRILAPGVARGSTVLVKARAVPARMHAKRT